MSASQTLHQGSKERRLYTWVAFTVALLVLIGFARTYYLKSLYGTPALSGLVHLHGVVMTLWVVLFIVQVRLVAAHRVAIHRRLGVFGAVWAGVVFLVGMMTAITAARNGVTPGPPPLVFLSIPLGDILVFGVLVGCALYFRRRKEIHKRLMLLSCAALLPAAIARIPLDFIAAGGPLAFFGLTDLCLLAVVVYDTVKHRRLHPAFGWGLLFVIATHPLRLILSGTDGWMRFATWLTG